jgi:hypothetical protein
MSKRKKVTKKQAVTHNIILEDKPEDRINSIISELADRLSKDQASVMIGAGFSKNAKSLGKKTTMPSLLELGEPFYRKLNDSKPPPNKITDISDVQELAAKIEEIYERTVLDEIIEKEIPDKEFEPSILHTKLFEIPWRDIYTTNYDTLLERASSGKYELVTREEELRLTNQHRIIKLHGSFPSSKPYIITKKDFDSYPKKYQIFVNNVKNTLVEKKFCLIGFAGTDPNFLNWINWLKTASTKEYIPTIYYIGVGISEDDINLLKNKNIQAIDISLISKKLKNKIIPDPTGTINRPPTTDDYKEAYLVFFDRLLDCLTEKRETTLSIETTSLIPDWPEKKHIHPYPENEIKLKFKEVIDNWKVNREKYPGWVVLSENRRKILRDFTETSFIYNLDKLDNFLDLKFLFEMNWRTEKYLYPLFDDCAKIYKRTLDKYNPFHGIINDRKEKIIPRQGDRINWNEIRNIWLELNFALLKYYRQEDLDKDWYNIAKQIEKIKHKLNPEQKARYHYERCLFYLFYLNIQMIRIELANWKVDPKLPFWESKRAGIIAELGDVSEALNILKKSIEKNEKQLKKEKLTKNFKLLSQKAYMLDLYDFIQRSVNFTNGDWSWNYRGYNEIHSKIKELNKYECSPWDDLDYFETILKFDAPDYKQIENTYGFKLNSIFVNQYYGTDVYTIRTYSFIIYMEEIGFPFRLPGISFGGTAIKQSIKRLQRFSPVLSLITFIRARDEKSINNVLSRRMITMFTSDFVNSLSASLLKIIKKSKNEIHNGDTDKKTNMGISISTILPEILGRLTIKASFSIRKELVFFIKSVYASKDRNKYEGLTKLMEYLLESFSNSEQRELINIFLDFPILPDTQRNKFPDPFSFIALDKIKVIKGKKINTARVNESIIIAKNNNERREKAIIRLLVLWRFQLLTKSQIKKFESVLWEFTNEEGFPAGMSNHFYHSTFLWFPHPKYINPEIIFRHYINNIQLPIQAFEKEKGIIMTNGHISLFGNIIGTFNNFYKYKWSQEELHILIDKILDWWDADKKYLITDNKNRDDSIKNEFKARFNNMLSIFACIFQPYIDEIEKSDIQKINHILSELKQYHIPDIMARASVIKIFPKTIASIITDLCDGLYSKNEDIIPDAIAGMMVLLRQKCNGIEKIIEVISQNIKCRTDIDLYRFISIMNTIVCDYPEYINDTIMNDVDFGLYKLITETVIDNESTDKDTHSKQNCRRHSVELASSLKKYYTSKKIAIPNSIIEWEKIALNPNEIVEIRNAWF